MKVLITWVDGYIGVKLAELLTIKWNDVSGIDTWFYRDGWLYNDIKYIPRIINKDTRNIVLEDLIWYDAVIHLADLSNDPLGEMSSDNTYAINYEASVNLAKLAKLAWVQRFIYSSSCSVYGIANSDFVDEESPTNPQTHYAKCKLLVEEAIKKICDSNFCATFLRNATVFWASPRMRFDLVVNNLSAMAFLTKKIVLSSDGSPWRPIVHINDLCNAFAAVLESPVDVVFWQIINVWSNSSNYKIIEIANTLREKIPDCLIETSQPNWDNRSYKVSFTKISQILPNFTPMYNLNQGIDELLEIFERIKLDDIIFKQKPFTRIEKIKYLIDSKQIDNNFYFSKV